MPIKKKLAGYLSLTLLALTLAGSPAAAECVKGAAPLFDPFAPYKDPGSIIHKESGFVFPASVGGFQRECEMTTDFPATISRSDMCGMWTITRLKSKSPWSIWSS